MLRICIKSEFVNFPWNQMRNFFLPGEKHKNKLINSIYENWIYFMIFIMFIIQWNDWIS